MSKKVKSEDRYPRVSPDLYVYAITHTPVPTDTQIGAREMAQLVKYLSFKHENLSLACWHPYKKLSALICSCNSNARDLEAEGPLGSVG